MDKLFVDIIKLTKVGSALSRTRSTQGQASERRPSHDASTSMTAPNLMHKAVLPKSGKDVEVLLDIDEEVARGGYAVKWGSATVVVVADPNAYDEDVRIGKDDEEAFCLIRFNDLLEKSKVRKLEERVPASCVRPLPPVLSGELMAREMAKARVGDWLDLWYDDVKSAEDEEDRCWWPVQVDKIHLASQNGPSGSEDAEIVEAFDVHYQATPRLGLIPRALSRRADAASGLMAGPVHSRHSRTSDARESASQVAAPALGARPGQ